MAQKKFKLNLVSKLIVAIILGIIVGQLDFIPEVILRLPITFSSMFSSLLAFIIPLMIVGFVVIGIAELSDGAGMLLALTTGIAYTSTIIGGTAAYTVSATLFPHFITDNLADKIAKSQEGLEPLFSIPLSPFFDVTGAIVFSFMIGICISWLRRQGSGQALYHLFSEFRDIITRILGSFIVPLLPYFIFGNFINLSYTGSVFDVLKIFGRVFVTAISLHLVGLVVIFVIAGLISKKSPIQMLKNQIPGYVTAVGTQSSAATIPVNLSCAEKNGVSESIRDFVIPLCATIHLLGSMITITCCVTAVLMMFGKPHGLELILPFIFTLGIAMVAAPGAPGGAIMSALPFMGMVGISPEGTIAQLLITLYLTQDSFGTATNVSGDNAIAVIVDTWYKRYEKKRQASASEASPAVAPE